MKCEYLSSRRRGGGGGGGGALPYESEGLDARRLTRVHIADFSLT